MGGGGMSGMFAQAGATIGDIADYHIGRRQGALAARAQIAGQRKANALYTNLYDQTSGDYSPYMQGGQSAFAALLKTYGLGEGQSGQPDYSAFENSPDYQFALQQGIKARDNSAASNGRLYSGAYDKALMQYGQGMASQQLGAYRGGLQGISNTGFNATNALANYRAGYGNQLGQGYNNLGDIAAAEALGRSALHQQFNASQKSVWGVGGGGGSPSGGNALSSSYGSGMNFGTGYGQNSGPGSGYYNGPGSSTYQFNPYGN